jgi:alpha-tubulin suppressor-like RCC1 family protein
MLAASGMAHAQCRLGINSEGSHSLLLSSSGTVYTWGYNNSGQLGDSTRDNAGVPPQVLKGEYAGMKYLGDNPSNPIIAVAALYRHSLALAADGTLYGWGANLVGELGVDPPGNQLVPVKVWKGLYNGTKYLGDDPSNRITAISGGINMSMVLARDGTIYAFGRNDYGQLGNGMTDNSMTAVRVLKGEYNGTMYLGDDPKNRVVAIANGDYQSLALTEDGSLYAWGHNDRGQLGTGDTTAHSLPVRVLKGDYNGTFFLGDDPNNRVVAIAAGGDCSLAKLADGTLMMWGKNYDGRLGDNTMLERHLPVHVVKGNYNGTALLGDNPDNRITSIAMGRSNVLVLTQDGSLFAWGTNAYGALGINSRVAQSAPVRVLKGEYTGVKYLGDDPARVIHSIAVGEDYAMAIVGDCEIYTWGRNLRGQIGDGTFTDRLVPVRSPIIGSAPKPAVALTSFTASMKSETLAQVRWTTAWEQGIASFELERSIDGGAWQRITSTAGQGTTAQAHDYSYDDDVTGLLSPEWQMSYRLKQIGTGGDVQYIDSVSLEAGPISSVDEKIIAGGSLLQNIPNPFASSTVIEYRLPARADVRLEIRDLLGNLVETLVDRTEEAGSYHQRVDASNLTSGVYSYRLTIGAWSTMKWMIVAR